MTPAGPSRANAGDSVCWQQLPPELALRTLRLLPPNEIVFTARIVCKAAAALFASPPHRHLHPGQPIPAHAFARWAAPGAMRCLTYAQRQRLLCLAASSGHLTALELLLRHAGCLLSACVLSAAAAAGQLPACDWLLARGCPVEEEALEAAAAAGQLAACARLLRAGCPLAQHAAHAAAGAGQASVCAWLLERGCADCCGAHVAVGAAYGGHVGLVEWLLEAAGSGRGGGPWRAGERLAVLAALAAAAPLPGVQRLYDRLVSGVMEQGGEGGDGGGSGAGGGEGADQRREQAGWVMDAAAGSTTPDWQDKVEWLAARGFPAHADACTAVGACGDDDGALGRLTWLRDRGFSFGPGVVREAAGAGHVRALQYLVSEGAPVDSTAVSAAVCGGHLCVLRQLARLGHTPDAAMLEDAAAGGHVAVLSWLVEELYGRGAVRERLAGAQSYRVMHAAAAAGAAGAVEWLAARGCPLRSGAAAAAAAGAGGRGGELLRWLVGRGCPLAGGVFAAAAGAGCEERLEWLAAAGCPMGDNGEPYLVAGANGDLATLACLRRLGCPWGLPGPRSAGTFAAALEDGLPPAVLRWMAAAGCPVEAEAAAAAAACGCPVEGEVAAAAAAVGSNGEAAPSAGRPSAGLGLC